MPKMNIFKAKYGSHCPWETSTFQPGLLQKLRGTPHLQYAPVIEPPYTLQIQFVTLHSLSANLQIPSVTPHQQYGTTRRNLQVRTFCLVTCIFLLHTRTRQVPTLHLLFGECMVIRIFTTIPSAFTRTSGVDCISLNGKSPPPVGNTTTASILLGGSCLTASGGFSRPDQQHAFQYGREKDLSASGVSPSQCKVGNIV
jgi:hypothetical protein